MQEFLADLHIHSRFSRATSKKLGVPLLAAWARLKGITVLGTGDFTHPKWREELREHLRFDEQSGLYMLKNPDSVSALLPELPVACLGQEGLLGSMADSRVEDMSGLPVPPVHFMLQGEISSIYKRGGQVRKVHNLVFMPNLEAAERFSLRLGEIGNLNADGRPIIGLDSKNLLEMVLETHPQAFLVPAHIWTPWFSLFGSKSGFNRLEDCFDDLSTEIFALETGLSSDPAMNRLWSALDGYRLISNSDAHSGENLGREANLFSGAISYQGMLSALKTPSAPNETSFLGTLEFFPEEGKYHMDGHRKCNLLLTPAETRSYGGVCPVCGGQITVGVLNRVMELADREEPVYDDQPGMNEDFASLVPLPEILGEIYGVGAKSRKVGDMYAKALERFGPELAILRNVPEAELNRFFPPLAEAIGRMRRGEVRLQGGFDGEYGSVQMFSEEEQKEIRSGLGTGRGGKKNGASLPGISLPGVPPASKTVSRTGRSASLSGVGRLMTASDTDEPKNKDSKPEIREGQKNVTTGTSGAETSHSGASSPVAETSRPHSAQSGGLNPEQLQAIHAGPGPVLVLAGPGTGKTRTLIARISRLIADGVNPRRILAVTFTRRAASEMDERLAVMPGRQAIIPRTDTLHALALEAWHKTQGSVPVLLSEESARQVFVAANPGESAQTLREAWQSINLARERLEIPLAPFQEMARRYAELKASWRLADYTDLPEFWLHCLAEGVCVPSWSHVLVDEVQDLSPLQLQLVRALLPASGEGFFGIGDPAQSIYSFRGAHGQCRRFFSSTWPGLQNIVLTRNYRSLGNILTVSHAALGEQADGPALEPARTGMADIFLFSAPSADAEAAWVADRVAALVGLGSHTLADAMTSAHQSHRSLPGARGQTADHSPGDIAVLVRTHALAGLYRKALHRVGVPVTEPAADTFWADERIRLILHEAGRMLGIAVAAPRPLDNTELPPCPERVLGSGPLGFAAYLSEMPPFDALFWRGSAFRALVKAYDDSKGWEELLTWINLQNELELVRGKGEKVQIISMHAAKGLEFRTVFLPALEDGLLPFTGIGTLHGSQEAKLSSLQLAEEQRLFYVALTRAKDTLYLSNAGKRLLHGRELRLNPSRFLQLLPVDLLTRSMLVARTTQREKQLTLL